MDWTLIGTTFAAGFIRGVTGWAKNSLADNEISEVEWKELGKTTLIIGAVSFAVALGFGNIENNELIGISAGFIVNELWRAFSKKNK